MKLCVKVHMVLYTEKSGHKLGPIRQQRPLNGSLQFESFHKFRNDWIRSNIHARLELKVLEIIAL